MKKGAIIRAAAKFKARETEKIERWNRYKRRFYEMYNMEREVRNVKAETERGDRNKEQKLT